jgi:hypothetical protein
MRQVIFEVLPAVAPAAATLYKAPGILANGSRSGHAYLAAMASMSVSMVVFIPYSWATLDRLTGVANLAQLVVDSAAIVGGHAATVAVLHELDPTPAGWRRVLHRRLGTVVCLASMAILFYLAHAGIEDVRFVHRYGAQPFIMAYLVLMNVVLALIAADCAQLAVRFSRSTFIAPADGYAQPLLRVGVRVAAVGAAAASGYCGYNLLALYGQVTHQRWPAILTDPLNADRAMMAVIMVMLAAGSTMPTWATNAQPATSACWRYMTRLRLFLIWYDLTRCSPEVLPYRLRGPN